MLVGGSTMALSVMRRSQLAAATQRGRARPSPSVDVEHSGQETSPGRPPRLLRLFTDERSAAPARRGLELLADLFGRGGERAEMAGRAVAGVMDTAEIRLSCELLSGDLIAALHGPEE